MGRLDKVICLARSSDGSSVKALNVVVPHVGTHAAPSHFARQSETGADSKSPPTAGFSSVL